MVNLLLLQQFRAFQGTMLETDYTHDAKALFSISTLSCLLGQLFISSTTMVRNILSEAIYELWEPLFSTWESTYQTVQKSMSHWKFENLNTSSDIIYNVTTDHLCPVSPFPRTLNYQDGRCPSPYASFHLLTERMKIHSSVAFTLSWCLARLRVLRDAWSSFHKELPIC